MYLTKKLILVIGPNAMGKSTFIRHNFSDENCVLDVFDYQKREYEKYGCVDVIPYELLIQCLLDANNTLLSDIIKSLNKYNIVVVEQTFYMKHRRLSYINVLKKTFPDIEIEIYVMQISDEQWKENCKKIGANYTVKKHETEIFEFPEYNEGYSKIYSVDENFCCELQS